ncbi:MAG TPA: DUF6306 domain-containing protein [Alphaproteobacteria bacterium]
MPNSKPDPDKDEGHEREARIETSSPPCFAHEMDPVYAGYMPQDEIIAFLNVLLEGERAGAKAVALLQSDAASDDFRQAVHPVGVDEGRFCAMLSRHITRLGGRPSPATGSFYEKFRAVAGLRARLAFLNRGQDWVVRKLNETLPRIQDDALYADLREMRDVHVRNVERCTALMAGLPPAA